MSELKRLPVKYVRDFIKKDYKYDACCFICGSTEKLELHHVYSVSELWNNWLDAHKYSNLTVDQVMKLRVDFYNDNKEHLDSHNLYTLCKVHHQRLHNIYGARYSNWRSEKVKIWIVAQKEKFGEQNGRADKVD
jgi:transcription elongation factor Elf1